MLVFFMHGASVRNPGYADAMRSVLVEQFSQQGLAVPEFYSSFWGEALGQASQMWDCVQQDLESFRWEHPDLDLDDVFHYRQRREQLISGFFNDIFTYLNTDRGKEVRRIIAVQFLSFLTEAPVAEDLHIVAHSLGSVILWDILFSEQFAPGDPAFYIRNGIKGLSAGGQGRKVKLRSVTTMGCPQLFFNQALGIHPDTVKRFADRYVATPLRWINLIHASDVFAYPLKASLELDNTQLDFRDVYLGERNLLKRSLGDVTMAFGVVSDHSSYWRSQRVAQVVFANLVNDEAGLHPPLLEPWG